MRNRRFIYGLVGGLCSLITSGAINLLTGTFSNPLSSTTIGILAIITLIGTGTGVWYSTRGEKQDNPHAIRAKGITSEEGGFLAEDHTGRGIDVQEITAKTDIMLSARGDTPNPK